jgi:hypothetical protein
MPQLPPWPPVRHPVGSNRAIVVAEVWQRVDVVYVFWLRFLARQGSALGSARGIDTKEATNGHHHPLVRGEGWRVEAGRHRSEDPTLGGRL